MGSRGDQSRSEVLKVAVAFKPRSRLPEMNAVAERRLKWLVISRVAPRRIDIDHRKPWDESHGYHRSRSATFSPRAYPAIYYLWRSRRLQNGGGTP